MINSELLKEAIADAKAVRVTAYANAKASLQERFDKRFEAVFADKLREDAQEEEEEGTMQEVEAPNQIHGAGGEAHGPATKPVSKGQPSTNKKSGKDFKPVQAGEGPTGVGKLHQPIMETEVEEGEQVAEQYEEEEEGKMDEAGLTSEDLDEIIKELEAEVAGEEEGQHVEEPVDFHTSPEGDSSHEDEPHVDGDPSVDGEPVDVKSDEKPHEHDPKSGEDISKTPSPEGEPHSEDQPAVDVNAEPGSEVNLGPEAGQMPPQFGGKGENEEDINLEELLAALNESGEEEEEEGKKMDEIDNHGVPKNVGGQDKTGGTNTYPKGPDASKKQLPGKNHNIMGKGNVGSGSPDGKPLRETEQYKVALKEAYKTIEFLRGQINEVNLLNAKLLYTNKLFKEFATVIDESYRMKIVESFDLTKSVREVKLAYALLAESLNFGSKRTIVAQARPTSKVDPAKKAIVKQITEGLASKPVASTKPNQELILEDAQVSRFKKLAGIKTPVAPKSK